MRTTLAIDDDVLIAARAIARQRHISVGEVISELARRALRRPGPPPSRNGIPLLPVSDPQSIATLKTVNSLRNELL